MFRQSLLFFLFSIFLVSNFGCARKKLASSTQQASIADFTSTYSDPAQSTPECPQGIQIRLRGSTNQTYLVNQEYQFDVSASGCLFGYLLNFEGQTRAFGNPTSNASLSFSSSVYKRFSSPGNYSIGLDVLSLNRAGQPVRRFRASALSITVRTDNSNNTLSCSVNPRSFNANGNDSSTPNFPQLFTVQTNQAAHITSISSSNNNLASSSNSFSQALSTDISSTVTLNKREGVLTFNVVNGSGQTSSCQSEAYLGAPGVSGDFDGNGITDLLSTQFVSTQRTRLVFSLGQISGMFQQSIIEPLATGFMNGENYEQVLVGDLNGDRKTDLLLFRKNGTPLQADFALGLSNSNGGLSFDFRRLIASWPSNQILTDLTLDATSQPPRILGKIGTSPYYATISLNTSTISVPQPVITPNPNPPSPNPPAVNSCSLVATRQNNSNVCSLSVTFSGAGADFTRAPQINRDDPQWMIDPSARGSWDTSRGVWTGTVSCSTDRAIAFSAYINLQSGSGDRPTCQPAVVPSLAPPPACSLAVSRIGSTDNCSVSVSFSGSNIDTSLAPQINRDNPSWTVDSSAQGNWNSAGNMWSGTTSCNRTTNVAFSAYVNIRGGSVNRPVCGPITVPRIEISPATSLGSCRIEVSRQGTSDNCDINISYSGGTTNRSVTPQINRYLTSWVIDSSPRGSWSSSGANWIGTTFCPTNQTVAFSAYVEGTDGPSNRATCDAVVVRSLVAPPRCALTVSRQGSSNSCTISVAFSGNALDTTRSPQINRDDPSWMIDPNATGSWNLNGTLWTGTAACTAGKATQFSAYVNLRDGSLDRPECIGGVSR